MPLQIERLRKSKSWLRCKRRPELAFYLLNLWMRAWHEVPAGSIEDDDDILADAAMCSPEAWPAIRDDVLAGWERRDGRLFHSTVTELATEAEGKLRKNKKRTEAAREVKQQRREGTVTEAVTEAVTELVTETVTSHEGKGREEEVREEPNGSLSETPLSDDVRAKAPKRKRPEYPADFDAAWLAYPRSPNMSKAEALPAWRRLSVEDRALVLPSIAGYRAYLATKPDLEVIHFARYLSKRRFEGYAGEAAASATESDWLKRLEWARTNRKWSASEWGPMPGVSGCNAPLSLLLPGDGVGWAEWSQRREPERETQ
jgi:uncharacterized protein YdaU (DUF1376 family)